MKYLIATTSDPRAAVERLRAVEPHTTDGASVAELTAGCVLYDVLERGDVVATVAVEYHDGDRATIKAAAGRVDFAAALVALEDRLRQRGVRTVGLFTRRAGLLRNLGRAGYSLAQAELVKAVA